MKPKLADMSPTDIRIAMMRAKVTQAKIARNLGVTQEAVWQIIEGKFVSHRIRTEIANQIGLDIKRIWPSTYMFGGPRKAGRPMHKAKRAA